MSQINFFPAKYIRLFLVENPQDTRLTTAEIGNWTGKLILINRDQVKNKRFHAYPDLKRRGVYFLFGVIDAKPSVYVGEGEVIIKRIKGQLALSFWQEAVIFVSKDNYLNKASIKYLEHQLYCQLKNSDLYDIVNNTKPTKPGISEAEQAELEESFKHILLLTPKFSKYHI